MPFPSSPPDNACRAPLDAHSIPQNQLLSCLSWNRGEKPLAIDAIVVRDGAQTTALDTKLAFGFFEKVDCDAAKLGEVLCDLAGTDTFTRPHEDQCREPTPETLLG
jgi:hypothetical protein